MPDIGKIMRLFIASFVFLCVMNTQEAGLREFQQFFFWLGCMTLFGLLLRNIWITLFLWWTIFLFIYTKFNVGQMYVESVFLGCVLYYITKVSFKREHINLFLNAILWVAVINIMYGWVQVSGYDFIYKGRETLNIMGWTNGLVYNAPNGFMGNSAITAILYTLCIPILFTRGNRVAIAGGMGMFLMLFMIHASTSFVAGIVTLSFLLWFKIPRRVWVKLIILFSLVGVLFIQRVDMPGFERIDAWKMMLQDARVHSITGLGLDSFRNLTKNKNFRYGYGTKETRADGTASYWDNPHNLYISLFYEWGIIGLIIMGGYVRQNGVKFLKSVKTPNLLALTGMGIVFFIVSIGQFPMFIARLGGVILVPCAAMFEIETRGG